MDFKTIWASYNLPPIKLRRLLARSHSVKAMLILFYVCVVGMSWGNVWSVLISLGLATALCLFFGSLCSSLAYTSLMNGTLECGHCGQVCWHCERCDEAYCVKCEGGHQHYNEVQL